MSYTKHSAGDKRQRRREINTHWATAETKPSVAASRHQLSLSVMPSHCHDKQPSSRSITVMATEKAPHLLGTAPTLDGSLEPFTSDDYIQQTDGSRPYSGGFSSHYLECNPFSKYIVLVYYKTTLLSLFHIRTHSHTHRSHSQANLLTSWKRSKTAFAADVSDGTGCPPVECCVEGTLHATHVHRTWLPWRRQLAGEGISPLSPKYASLSPFSHELFPLCGVLAYKTHYRRLHRRLTEKLFYAREHFLV